MAAPYALLTSLLRVSCRYVISAIIWASIAVLSVMMLEPWAGCASALALLAGMGGVCYILLTVLDADLNLISATNVFVVGPMVFDASFSLAFRYSAYVTALAVEDDVSRPYYFLREHIEGCFTPALVVYALVMSIGVLPFVGCSSPVNILFFQLFEVTIAISVGLSAVVVAPFIAFIGAVSGRGARIGINGLDGRHKGENSAALDRSREVYSPSIIIDEGERSKRGYEALL